ncbi:MAG: hypothetical protein N2053_02835 [Chitinispirillaceae bacterium]|nr:hypothetical protein [Chitinispirillaceae bacterium]
MSSDSEWKVISVYGHQLEQTLNELSENKYEVVFVERVNKKWTIIAHLLTIGKRKTERVIGFTPPGGLK